MQEQHSDSHSIPVGGGNAPHSCLPTANKPHRRRGSETGVEEELVKRWDGSGYNKDNFYKRASDS